MKVLPHAIFSSAVTLLLVAQDAMAAAGPSHSAEKSGTTIVWMVIGAGVLVALGVTAEVVRRVLRNQRCNSPNGLFYDLCRTHGLDRSARTLLWDVACLHNLAHPARVFTEPRWLDPAGLQNSLGVRVAEAAALHTRLFGESEDAASPPRQTAPAAR